MALYNISISIVGGSPSVGSVAMAPSVRAREDGAMSRRRGWVAWVVVALYPRSKGLYRGVGVRHDSTASSVRILSVGCVRILSGVHGGQRWASIGGSRPRVPIRGLRQPSIRGVR